MWSKSGSTVSLIARTQALGILATSKCLVRIARSLRETVSHQMVTFVSQKTHFFLVQVDRKSDQRRSSTLSCQASQISLLSARQQGLWRIDTDTLLQPSMTDINAKYKSGKHWLHIDWRVLSKSTVLLYKSMTSLKVQQQGNFEPLVYLYGGWPFVRFYPERRPAHASSKIESSSYQPSSGWCAGGCSYSWVSSKEDKTDPKSSPGT